MQVFRHSFVSVMNGMRLAIPAMATDMNDSGEAFVSVKMLGSKTMCNTIEIVRTEKKMDVAMTYCTSFCLAEICCFLISNHSNLFAL